MQNKLTKAQIIEAMQKGAILVKTYGVYNCWALRLPDGREIYNLRKGSTNGVRIWPDVVCIKQGREGLEYAISKVDIAQTFEGIRQKFEALQGEKDLNVYFDKLEPIKNSLRELCHAAGFINALSKENIIFLVRIQSKIRFMPDHSFYLLFTK